MSDSALHTESKTSARLRDDVSALEARIADATAKAEEARAILNAPELSVWTKVIEARKFSDVLLAILKGGE